MDIKYKEIYTYIKQEILSGNLANNERLDNEIVLCQKFNCSRMTVKKALDMLVHEGLLFRKRGQGSFVRVEIANDEKFIITERELTGLTAAANTEINTKIIKFELIFASEKIASLLNMKVNQPLYSICRLRYINNFPCVIEQTYMNPAIIPDINEEILNHSIYNYIENVLKFKIGAAKKTSRACVATEKDKKYLLLDNHEPVLEIEQIAYLDNGLPFEYSFSRHRYDKFEFTTYSLRVM